MLMSLFNEETLRKEYDESLKKKSKEEGRAEGRAEGIEIGEKKGIEIGMLKTLIGLVKDGLLSLKDAAIRSNMTETEFANLPDMKKA